MMDIKKLKAASDAIKDPALASALKSGAKTPTVPFQDVFMSTLMDPNQTSVQHSLSLPISPQFPALEKQAALFAQAITEDQISPLSDEELNALEGLRRDTARVEPFDAASVNQEGYRTRRLEVTPFQLFMDKAIDTLESISATEMKVNNLIEQYIEGKVSIDEVSIESAKLNLAVSFATTVLTTATQTFTQLTQMAV